MYKSRIFTFNEDNLRRDIAHIEKSKRQIKELQCSFYTACVWLGIYAGKPIYPINKDEYSNILIGFYHEIPVRINDSLDYGIVGIKI